VTKWPHPESPTIDHIVPISNPNCPGDVKSNIQLAHWYCNLKKGNRIE
jgi:5-methylcytosine-specific restriction endonuclease McrA